MKNVFSALLAALMLAGMLAGCMNSSEVPMGSATAAPSQTEAPAHTKISIVTTIFPEYDWVREILGDKADSAEITMLLDKGADLHSYQPTADDLIKLSDCDLFVYVGGESDGWVDDALKNATNKNRKVINLLEILGDSVKEEETVEGMQAEEEDHEDHEEKEYDEHVWLSLKNAKNLVGAISESLQELDPGNKDTYAANADAYVQKLSALDAEYQKAVSAGTYQTVLFGDRFPFRYLVDDYGLSYYAAFVGCSAESEASFETVSFLARKVDEGKLPCVLTDRKSTRLNSSHVKRSRMPSSA